MRLAQPTSISARKFITRFHLNSPHPFVLISLCLTFTSIFLLWPPSADKLTGDDKNPPGRSGLFPYLNTLKKTKPIGSKRFFAPLVVIGRNGTGGKSRKNFPKNDWIRANSESSKHKFLVYSAFLDIRKGQNCVRVIAVTLTKKSPQINCQINLLSKRTITLVASKKPINEHWNLKYAAHILSCCTKPSEFASDIPLTVKLYEGSGAESSATLNIRRNQDDHDSPRGDLAVCVKPFHYSYDRSTWLIEFIEFHMMMGVEHFIFYNQSVGPSVQKVLETHERNGLVSIQPWQMDIVSQKEIRTEGLFAAFNDCVYRLMHLFKYVLVIDVDEFIVPKTHTNYLEMFKSIEKDDRLPPKYLTKKACYSGYSFKNAFFYLYWENDTSTYGQVPETKPRYLPYLLTQYKTRRLTEANKHGSRSKFFVMPDRVFEIGNHNIWRAYEGCRPALVPEETAVLHHFRICEFGGFDCLKKPSSIDRTANRFGATLLGRVLGSCDAIFPGLETTCPLSLPLGDPY